MDWICWQDAVCLYARDAVSWTLGQPCLHIHGGYNRLHQARSVIALHPIIAARGQAPPQVMSKSPVLTNAALFIRDNHLCLYCGHHYPRWRLTRDHVLPISQGGLNCWDNVVTACVECNAKKGGRSPQQARMPLLAAPYSPRWIEHMILSNRNILADQMDFLGAQLSRQHRRLPLLASQSAQ